MPPATTPPDLDAVRRRLRPAVAELPQVLAAWREAEGPLADVPLLHPDEVDPWAFRELAGTVRVASTAADLVTLGGLLDLPDDAGVLVTAVAAGPEDLAPEPDAARARAALALAGARRDDLPVEVVALLAPVDGRGGPVAGVGIVRPLVLADPAAFPHPDDDAAYEEGLRRAAREAVAEDRDVVAELAGPPLVPLPAATARVWGPLFAVARAATVGLAARGAAGG